MFRNPNWNHSAKQLEQAVETDLVVKAMCLVCGEVSFIEMLEADWRRWRAGENIQDVAPYPTVGERELLISDVCSECFDDVIDE